MMAEPKTVRWGIIGPGNIAQTFTRNLLQHSPSSRGTTDIVHTITGVASASSSANAQSFITKHIAPYQSSTIQCTPYGSYLSIIQSTDVDVVYIATPHSSHFKTAMLALTNNKAVLVEKPLCVNAAQAQILIETARSRGVFLMEAMWTRFFPLSLFVQDAIQRGEIGEVVKVSADFSLGVGESDGWEDVVGGVDGRMLNPKLAGGVVLDLGIYSLTWIFMCVYHLRHGESALPTLIGAAMTPQHRTTSNTDSSTEAPWVDTSTTLLLTLPSAPIGKTLCHAVASTSLATSTDPAYGGDNPNDRHAHRYSIPSVRIQGTNGEIQVFGPLPRPQRLRLFTKIASEGDDNTSERTNETVMPGNVVQLSDERGYHVQEIVFESMGDGTGMYWEADEVGRCLRDGKLESTIMPWKETLAVMKVMEEARRKCGLDYGDEVEGVRRVE